jgi:hypothetical protein
MISNDVVRGSLVKIEDRFALQFLASHSHSGLDGFSGGLQEFFLFELQLLLNLFTLDIGDEER